MQIGYPNTVSTHHPVTTALSMGNNVLWVGYAIFGPEYLADITSNYSATSPRSSALPRNTWTMAATPTSKSYQTLLSLKDPRFDANALSKYYLSIHVSDAHFKVSCVDPATTQCLLLETYILAYSRAYRRVNAIEQLYRDHPLLAAYNWAGVTVSIGNQQYTLVPKHLFQEDKIATYLDFTCLVGADTIRHCMHPTLNMAVAFAMDSLLLNWFEKAYQSTRLCTIHQASSLIEGTWTYLTGYSMELLPKLLVFVETNHLHITVIQEKKLLYYNRFGYASSDELLHYILIVMRTLKLDANVHEVILGGNISKGSLAYRKARNYIRRISFSQRPTHLKFRRIFSIETVKNHFDVLSAHLCRQALGY
ncbi:MAG: DUF3822 family protein [Roseivirga sp.]